MPATVLRAAMAAGAYGPARDWANATETEIHVIIFPTTELSDTSDREYRKTRYDLFGAPDLDLLATDRIVWADPRNGLGAPPLTLQLDADPYVFIDPHGIAHHLEAKLKVITGVEGA